MFGKMINSELTVKYPIIAILISSQCVSRCCAAWIIRLFVRCNHCGIHKKEALREHKPPPRQVFGPWNDVINQPMYNLEPIMKISSKSIFFRNFAHRHASPMRRWHNPPSLASVVPVAGLYYIQGHPWLGPADISCYGRKDVKHDHELIGLNTQYHPTHLTHWGRMTHICVGKLTIIGSDNGLSPDRRQVIIWTNAGILLIGPSGTNFNEILIEIPTFSFKKMRLNVLSAKWRPFCLGLNVLTLRVLRGLARSDLWLFFG